MLEGAKEVRMGLLGTFKPHSVMIMGQFLI